MKTQLNVLIAEDEFIVAQNIKQQVKDLGYNVVDIVTNEQEVFNAIENNKIDLILMDVMLDGSMDGIDIAKKIKELYPISFVFITAFSSDEYFKRARLVEPHGYLLKPFTNRDLSINIELAAYKHTIDVELRDAKLQLEVLNKQLEERVAIRTENLKVANSLLLSEIKQRKINEEKLIASEQKNIESQKFISSINHSVPFIIFILNTDQQKLTFINNQIYSILGYLPEEIYDTPLNELMRLYFKSEVVTKFPSKLNLINGYFEKTIQIKHKISGLRWLNIRMVDFKEDDNGDVTEIIGSATDITEQRKNERKLNAMMRLNSLQDKRTQKIRTLSLIEGQEEERRRISRDIHDGIGQMLTALKFNIENFDNSNLILENEKYKNVKELIRETIIEVRRISNALAPPGLYDFGLYSVAKQLLDQLSKSSSIQIHFDSNIQNVRYIPLVEITLYRIIQESINNSLKHSKAENLELTLNHDHEKLELIICDDGIGLDYSKVDVLQNKYHGNGLRNIKERASFIGANLTINSKPNQGCCIKISIPIKNCTL